MKLVAALILLALLGTPAAAQDGEDAAHRADRLQTRALNARSSNGYARAAPRPADRDAYDAARADYRERLAAWRRQVAACEAGAYDACQH